jgi:hypothetical protein
VVAIYKVAAKVASHELWILGVVKSINEKTKTFEVYIKGPSIIILSALSPKINTYTLT